MRLIKTKDIFIKNVVKSSKKILGTFFLGHPVYFQQIVKVCVLPRSIIHPLIPLTSGLSITQLLDTLGLLRYILLLQQSIIRLLNTLGRFRILQQT